MWKTETGTAIQLTTVTLTLILKSKLQSFWE